MTDATVSDSVNGNAEVLDAAQTKAQLSFAELMPRVASEHGKSMSSQVKDLIQFVLRHHKLSVDEYYQMALYDDARYDREAKRRFLGLAKSREIWKQLMALNRHLGLIDDKLMFERTLSSFGFSVPKTIAVMGGHYPENSIPQITDADSFHAFLVSAEMPVFAKPIDSLGSLGSVRIEGYSPANKMISVSNGNVVSLDGFLSEVEHKFSGGYLFQNCVQRHPTFAQMTGGGLSTIRLVTLDSGSGPQAWRAVAKLTSPHTVADNFWRAGNLLAAVHLDSGKMEKALTSMGMDGAFVSNHPDTNEPIEGVEIPYWDQVLQIAKDVAGLFPNALLLGFDIAITPDGPTIIETNADPHLILMQIAHQKGAMDDEMNATLAHCEALRRQIHDEIIGQLKRERAEKKSEMKMALATKPS